MTPRLPRSPNPGAAGEYREPGQQDGKALVARRSAPRLAAPAPAPPAGPVVGELSVSTSWDPLLSLRALAAYSSLSERLLRSFLRAPHPLPHYRVGGRVLVRRSAFDAWLEVYREPAEGQDADAIVARLLADLDGPVPGPHARGA